MGVIQGSLNQAMGAVAGAALGVKHIQGQEAAAAEQASNNITEAEANISDLTEKSKAIMESHPELGTPGEADALALEEAEGGEDLAMAKKALETLGKKIEAQQGVIDRSTKVIESTRKRWGGIK